MYKLNPKNLFDRFYISLARLFKLLLITKQNEMENNKSFIIEDEKDNLQLKIKEDIYHAMISMGDIIYGVKTTRQNDTVTCGLHMIRIFDEIMRINHECSLTWNKEWFETKLKQSKQLMLCVEECPKLQSELLEYILNTNFVITTFTNSFETNVLETNIHLLFSN